MNEEEVMKVDTHERINHSKGIGKLQERAYKP